MGLSEQIAVARGDLPADQLFHNLQLVNVLSGDVHPAAIVVHEGMIVGLADDPDAYSAREVIDLGGRFVCPGLIDAHVHIESSLCTPPQFARALLAHGVTAAVTDPHEIANVFGIAGIRFMLEQMRASCISLYALASSCVPATHMGTSGASLDADDLQTLASDPLILGLAEMMNYPGVINADPDILAKLDRYRGRVLDGHIPAVTGKPLNAYIAAGIGSDHECTTVEEAREKLRRGLMIFIREGTPTRDLRALLPLVTPENHMRICFCTDDRQPADLLDEGSIDHMLRIAIAGGVDPLTAIRIATLNPAIYFGLHDHGAIAPGRRADLVVVDDLHDFRAAQVYRGGVLAASAGRVLIDDAPLTPTITLPPSMRVRSGAIDVTIPARGDHIHAIVAIDGKIVTERERLPARSVEGHVIADPTRDMLKIVVVERHHASTNIGKGFIRGFGLRHGAIGGSVAHDHHNLIVIGADDASITKAIESLIALGGGLVAVTEEAVLASLALPVAGLMSDAPIADMRRGYDALIGAARTLGSTLSDPFMTMSFMGLEVIPKLKLTDVGLIDVEHFTPIDLFSS